MTNRSTPFDSSNPAAPRRVLVLGARGRFGAAAVAAFAAAGWQVLAQQRRSGAASPWPAGVTAIDIPLADTAALARAAVGATVVVHAVNPLYTRWERELMPLAELGMAVAEQLGASFMLPGNVYNYGESMPALLDEDTPERPSTPKGRQRMALEAELATRAAAGRLRSVVIRAGDFFGAGQGSWLDLVIAKSLHQGRLVWPGPTEVVHAWAYLPDLARTFVAVAERAPMLAAAHTRLHFAGHAVTGEEFLAALETAATTLGLAPTDGRWRRGRLPWGLLRVGGVVWPMWRELARMAYLWHVPHALDGTRCAALLGGTGARAVTPLDQALRTALRALAQSPAAAAAPSAGQIHPARESAL
ncbi:MAG: hypothetical protein RIQ60_1621 [Pseudomonadota bacterium]|jgi:nucleoside-diphosphate-sugar epimerase